MRQRLERLWDQQVGFDDYLPGTPHPERRQYFHLADNFPYHVMGRSSLPTPEEVRQFTGAGGAEERRFREQDAVRRRQFPSCFEEACAYGNLQSAILMWSQGTVDIATRRAMYEGNNASALMWASFKGHLAIVRFLVDHQAPLEATNALGHTALQWAVTAGHADVVRYLLDHGADPSHRDRQGFDAAFAAVQNDRLALLLMLTEDAAREGHLLHTSDHGMVFYKPSAEQLTRAATTVNPRTQRPYYLLDPQLRDVEGHSLMHWAAYRNSPATCQYLIDHWSYDVNAQDAHRRTPLIWAAREGFAEVAELLLSRGADRAITDGEGWTALQHARVRNHPEAVYVLTCYPTSNALTSAEAAAAAAGGPAGTLMEHDGGSAAPAADSAKAVLLAATSKGISSGGGGRYTSVRDCRASGTLRLMRTEPLFAAMAVAGPAYVFVSFLVTELLPPIGSYFPFGMYFFKNVLWTALTPAPTQTSRATPASPSPTRQLGIAANIAESVRGTWRFRLRDPMNLFVCIAFLVAQVAAWNALGLVPFFSPFNDFHLGQTSTAADDALWGKTPVTQAPTVPTRMPIIHFFGIGLVRALTLQSNPLDIVAANVGIIEKADVVVAAEREYVTQSLQLVRWVLMLLVVATLVLIVVCKALSSRSMLRASEEGTLRASPLWRITAARQYRWLHPRFFFQERHMQMPLRAFYCPEHDVVVRGYDGYSALLDCPVGRANHLPFVLAFTCFALLEVLVLVWGVQQTRVLQRCSARESWYHDAFFAFQSTAAMEAAVRQRAATASTWMSVTGAPVGESIATTTTTHMHVVTETAVSTLAAAGVAPVVSLAWLNTAAEVLLHGLPCRPQRLLDEMTMEYVSATKASTLAGTSSSLLRFLRRSLFVFRYYLWPTRASVLGVWVLHYSFLAALCVGCVALRQWIGVWTGATRIELANPLAQGSDGELVTIFPKDPQQAQRLVPIDDDEERYYATVCPSKARGGGVAGEGGRCIYADGNGVVNLLSFLVGRNGRRWVGAMAVSSHNAPVKTPMLS